MYVIGQRLEDIDISVHCEIPIFDWLIKWVKKDLKAKNEWPSLGTIYNYYFKITLMLEVYY